MANYTPINNFTAKDALPTGDPLKRAKGADMQAELNAIAAALVSKVNKDAPETVDNQMTFTDIRVDCGTY